MESLHLISAVPDTFPANLSRFIDWNCGPRLASASDNATSLTRILTAPRCSSLEFSTRFRGYCQPEISASEVKLPCSNLPSTFESRIFCGSTENFPEADTSLAETLGSWKTRSRRANVPDEEKFCRDQEPLPITESFPALS